MVEAGISALGLLLSHTAAQAAHKYLTEIAEWSLILGAREFEFWGGLDK